MNPAASPPPGSGRIAAADAGRRRRCPGPRAARSADKTLRSGAAAPAPHSCRDLTRQASPRHDRSISGPVVPGTETCPPDAHVVVPGAQREAGQGGAGGRHLCSIAVPTALRQTAAGASGGPCAQARSEAQKAGRPRPTIVPGAAAPPPQQASGRWHRRAGPASRWPGGTCPGLGPDGPLAGRATPGSRAPGGRCPAPEPREGTLMPAMRPLRRPRAVDPARRPARTRPNSRPHPQTPPGRHRLPGLPRGRRAHAPPFRRPTASRPTSAGRRCAGPTPASGSLAISASGTGSDGPEAGPAAVESP